MRVARRQRVEVGDAIGIAAHDLRVDDAGREPGQGLANDGEASGEVFAPAAKDNGLTRGAVELSPPAVVLDLVQPLGPEGGDFLRTGAEGTMNAVRLSTLKI